MQGVQVCQIDDGLSGNEFHSGRRADFLYNGIEGSLHVAFFQSSAGRFFGGTGLLHLGQHFLVFHFRDRPAAIDHLHPTETVFGLVQGGFGRTVGTDEGIRLHDGQHLAFLDAAAFPDADFSKSSCGRSPEDGAAGAFHRAHEAGAAIGRYGCNRHHTHGNGSLRRRFPVKQGFLPGASHGKGQPQGQDEGSVLIHFL